MKQLRVTIVVRNNLLHQRREDLGMSQTDLCRAAGIQQNTYSGLERMTESPFTKGGMWRDPVLKIAAFHGLSPEELFPPEILDMRGGVRMMACDVDELAQLAAMGPETQALLRRAGGTVHALITEKCSPREVQVLTRRFGLDGNDEQSLAAVAAAEGVSPERIRQIENKAMEKLRRARAARDPDEQGDMSEWQT